jgi:hypothetical protein
MMPNEAFSMPFLNRGRLAFLIRFGLLSCGAEQSNYSSWDFFQTHKMLGRSTL